MYTLEKLNSSQITLQLVAQRHNDAEFYDTDIDHVIIFSITLPCLNFYQWNDFGESNTEYFFETYFIERRSARPTSLFEGVTFRSIRRSFEQFFLRDNRHRYDATCLSILRFDCSSSNRFPSSRLYSLPSNDKIYRLVITYGGD